MNAHISTSMRPAASLLTASAASSPLNLARWLGGFLAALLSLALTCAPPARADWSDDVDQIHQLMLAGNYAAAEKAASQSLAKGPSGLFSGTGTLMVHHWRGRARLLLGDAPGAIEDAQAIIQADSTMLPPDYGFALRGMAKALSGDASGALTDFDAALAAARKGMGSSGRAAAVLGDRALAKLLLGDLEGADTDLSGAMAADYGFLMSGYMNARKESFAQTRSAIARLKAGDIPKAREALNQALEGLTTHTETKGTSEFALFRLALAKVQAPVPQPAPLATAPAAAGPISFPVAAIMEAQRHFDRAVAMVEMARSHEDFLLALKEFEQAAKLVPVWADAHYNLAVMQEAVGKQRDALASYKRYLAIAPGASDAGKVRARVELLEKTRMR